MANELSASLTVVHSKTPRRSFRPNTSFQATQAGQGVFEQTLSIGTAEENVSFGDVSPGLVILQNLDPTNFVSWGINDGGAIKAPGVLYPSTEWPTMFWLKPGATLRMQADTGACEVQVTAYEL